MENFTLFKIAFALSVSLVFGNVLLSFIEIYWIGKFRPIYRFTFIAGLFTFLIWLL